MADVRTRAGAGALRLAAVAGLVHAAFSAYWAAGGTWLVETVGAAADALRAYGAVTTVLVLAVIAVVKALAAVLPVLVHDGRLPRLRRPVRAASWVGGSVLLLYGGASTLVAALVVSGVVQPSGPVDDASMVGHLLLWDPLFAVWGASLLVGLARSRHDGDRHLGGEQGWTRST